MLVNVSSSYFKMGDLANDVENHPAVVGKKFVRPISVVALSNDHGAAFATPLNDCAFRSVLRNKNYSVARQSINGLGINYDMRANNWNEVVNATVTYLYYKNGMLKNSNGEVLL